MHLIANEIENEFDLMVKEGKLIAELDSDGNKQYRVLRAVCMRCNYRIKNTLRCTTTAFVQGKSIEVVECDRCGREELIFEGHPDFEMNWEYAQ